MNRLYSKLAQHLTINWRRTRMEMFSDCFKHYSSMTHKTPIRIPTVCANIWTQNFPNMNQTAHCPKQTNKLSSLLSLSSLAQNMAVLKHEV